jgi:hypothetical protein
MTGIKKTTKSAVNGNKCKLDAVIADEKPKTRHIEFEARAIAKFFISPRVTDMLKQEVTPI